MELKISMEPTRGKMVVPSELNACANVSRLDAVAGSPSMEISGFATTCPTVIPEASTKRAARNAGNRAWFEAGMNRRQPTVISARPTTAVRM